MRILKIIVFTFLLIGYFSIEASCQNKDSLHQILESSTLIDSSFIETLQIYLNSKSLNYSLEDVKWIEDAKHVALKNKNLTQTAEMYHFLGWHYYQKSQIEASIENYLKAISLVENTDQSQLLPKYYTDLANSYNASNDFYKAIEINLKTLKLVAQDSSSSSKARYYFYAAKTYDRLEDYNQAETYYLEAKSISEEANFPFGIVLSNSSLGHNYNEQGEFEKALVLSKSALSAFQQGGFSLNLAGAFSIVANSYKGLKDYTKAAYNYEQAIRVYREIENTSYLKYNYTWLAYSYRMLGKSEDAFSNYGLALNYADTLFNQERTQAIEELKAKYETEKLIQDKEIADAESLVALEKAKRSKFVSYGAIFFAAIVSLLVALILNRLKLIRRQKRKLDDAYAQLEESKKNELAVSNLKALQSQMNPHFIFNALNSVQDLVLLQDIRSSNKYLGKFSDLIRKILLSSKAQFITLAEEVEILNLYLDLEKLRFGDDFEIDLKCDVPEDKQEDIDLPAMFIQPYLENAIKHGLFHKAGLKKLKVHFKLIGANTLECMVEDNGIGQEQAAIYKQKRLHLHTGFSTEAINERIRLLNETLVNKIELTIEDLFYHNQASGTRIILRFPVQELK